MGADAGARLGRNKGAGNRWRSGKTGSRGGATGGEREAGNAQERAEGWKISEVRAVGGTGRGERGYGKWEWAGGGAVVKVRVWRFFIRNNVLGWGGATFPCTMAGCLLPVE